MLIELPRYQETSSRETSSRDQPRSNSWTLMGGQPAAAQRPTKTGCTPSLRKTNNRNKDKRILGILAAGATPTRSFMIPDLLSLASIAQGRPNPAAETRRPATTSCHHSCPQHKPTKRQHQPRREQLEVQQGAAAIKVAGGSRSRGGPGVALIAQKPVIDVVARLPCHLEKAEPRSHTTQMALRRLIYSGLLLSGIAFLTKPSKQSFNRSVGQVVAKQAGGGLAGWAAAKLTAAAVHLSEATGQHTFEDLGVALLVRGTDELGDADWLFVGVFAHWIAVHRRELGKFVILRDPEAGADRQQAS
jgi:hypothetical protein